MARTRRAMTALTTLPNAATVPARGLPRLVDDLKLGKFSQALFAELHANPGVLDPPNGICGAMSICVLIHTVPASSRVATSCARSVLEDQTDAPSP